MSYYLSISYEANKILKMQKYLNYFLYSRILQHDCRLYGTTEICRQRVKEKEFEIEKLPDSDITPDRVPQVYANAKAVPMLLSNRKNTVLSFDAVPGPKALKYFSSLRQYLSEVGTQFTAGTLTLAFNLGNIFNIQKQITLSSALFDKYGSVVRFVSPIGGDIVLINKPEHIEKVFTMEGKFPVRSALDSLNKYRKEHRANCFRGLYAAHGEEWFNQRNLINNPINKTLNVHTPGIYETCEIFTQKVYNVRNHRDEVPKDLHKEVHKWAFDCMGTMLLVGASPQKNVDDPTDEGLLTFSKKFNMLATEVIYCKTDMSWLYESLENATKAIVKCESGIHMWKLFPTPAWYSLVKHCDNIDNLISGHVIEIQQLLSNKDEDKPNIDEGNLTSVMLASGMPPEDVTTVLMDMMILGVNTVATSMSFVLYHLAKYQKCQRRLYNEIEQLQTDEPQNIDTMKMATPYLQACIKETLRLVPPIPVLTRVLPLNITLDNYNIPRGTLILMCTRDSSLKESNYDGARHFDPDRWFNHDTTDYHAFASVPFGFGARKCLGQNIAETMLSVLTMKIMKKYHLEYHYGDIEPTKTFISKPNKALKIRFIDRF